MFQRTILAELEFRLKGEAVAGSCNFLVQESCYPGRSGHSVPVNQHQDKCYSLFSNFSSLYEWTLKGLPENGLSCIFQAVGNLLSQVVQSTLAWKIPWTEEPGRLQSMGSLRVGHD